MDNGVQLRAELTQLGKEIGNETYSDSFGNTYKINEINLVARIPNEKQPDDGVYKQRVTFILNIRVEYRFNNDVVPTTVFTDPVRRLWEMLKDNFSERYNFDDYDFYIKIERMYYELKDSEGFVRGNERRPNSMSFITGDGGFDSIEGLIKCDENFEQNITKLNFRGNVKINQVTYDKEFLDKKYHKVLDVLRKGQMKLESADGEPILVDYLLKDNNNPDYRFYYYTIPTYDYDTGEINSSKVHVRLIQSLEIKTNSPGYSRMITDIHKMVSNRLVKKFRQFNIELMVRYD